MDDSRQGTRLDRGLLQPATAEELPHGRDSSSRQSKNTIVEYESKIAVTGNDMHFFSDFQMRSWIDVDDGVFRGETDDLAA